MDRLTQASFNGKVYTIKIVSNNNDSIILVVHPLHPSSNEYVVNNNGSRFANFPATTKGFKDALQTYNILMTTSK